MLAIKGIYDGRTIRPLEKPPKDKKFKVVITFLEELDETEKLRDNDLKPKLSLLKERIKQKMTEKEIDKQLQSLREEWKRDI